MCSSENRGFTSSISCHIFRAFDPVTRRRPAVRKRGMRDRPPGADQLVPDLSGEPEVGVAVVVDVPDLGSSTLGISVPVAGDADPTRTVLIPLFEDPIPTQTSRSIRANSSSFICRFLTLSDLHTTYRLQTGSNLLASISASCFRLSLIGLCLIRGRSILLQIALVVTTHWRVFVRRT